MIFKKGMVEQVPLLIIAVFVGIAAIMIGYHFFGGPDGSINFFKNILPNFGSNGTSVEEGTIAYNLKDGQLYSFDGKNLVLLPSDKSYDFNGQKVSKKDLELAFYRYYYQLERGGSNFVDLSSFENTYDRSYSSPLRVLYGLIEGSEYGPGESSKIVTRVSLRGEHLDGNVEYLSVYMLEDGTFTDKKSDEMRKAIESSVNSKKDIILKGGACEKYISLFGKSYSVRGLDHMYLVVDLGEPKSGVDKYASCLANSNSVNVTVKFKKQKYFVGQSSIFSLITYSWDGSRWVSSIRECTDSTDNCGEPSQGASLKSATSFENGVADIIDQFDEANLADHEYSGVLLNSKYYLSVSFSGVRGEGDITSELSALASYALVKDQAGHDYYKLNNGKLISAIVNARCELSYGGKC